VINGYKVIVEETHSKHNRLPYVLVSNGLFAQYYSMRTITTPANTSASCAPSLSVQGAAALEALAEGVTEVEAKEDTTPLTAALPLTRLLARSIVVE